MRGYPKGRLTKQDFENLVKMPEHADQAMADMAKLAAISDDKITVDQGTKDEPDLVEIENPLPAWKLAGYNDREELTGVASTNKIQTEEVNITMK